MYDDPAFFKHAPERFIITSAGTSLSADGWTGAFNTYNIFRYCEFNIVPFANVDFVVLSHVIVIFTTNSKKFIKVAGTWCALTDIIINIHC